MGDAVGEEKAHNPRLSTTISEDRFVEIMDNLDLAPPRHMEDAVPANLSGGMSASAHDDAAAHKPLLKMVMDHTGVPPLPACGAEVLVC